MLSPSYPMNATVYCVLPIAAPLFRHQLSTMSGARRDQIGIQPVRCPLCYAPRPYPRRRVVQAVCRPSSSLHLFLFLSVLSFFPLLSCRAAPLGDVAWCAGLCARASALLVGTSVTGGLSTGYCMHTRMDGRMRARRSLLLFVGFVGFLRFIDWFLVSLRLGLGLGFGFGAWAMAMVDVCTLRALPSLRWRLRSGLALRVSACAASLPSLRSSSFSPPGLGSRPDWLHL
ncbi:hypothetical protein DFH08DRAFT_963815 [Mycena albidolilacea]|uniref:Uncharacterized protein n=1 Tax=Mycena albidolilacea TaxID=1033008 RepID=A0AAD6ZU21_9AGAR|nr:hypothetical protein DFH08DRAFT_963815 [Mycena albidolilacea]